MRVAQFAKGLFLWVLTVSAVQMPVLIFADATNEADDCSQKALRSYFPEKFVRETLKKFHVPEDRWTTIVQGLNAKEQDVEKSVESKAEKMSSNPLRDPNQRQAAVKIFKESLFETASQVLKANGVTDNKQIQDMVDDIQHQKARQFAQCIEKHKLPAMPMPNTSGSNNPNTSGSNNPSTSTSNPNTGQGPNLNITIDRSNAPTRTNSPSYSPSGTNR